MIVDGMEHQRKGFQKHQQTHYVMDPEHGMTVKVHFQMNSVRKV